MSDIFPGVPHVESPLFKGTVDDLGLDEAERQTAIDLHERGYAVIDFPDEALGERIERIKRNLAARFDVDMADPRSIKNSGLVQRVQDAWMHDPDVRAIATNGAVIDLLSKLYGRRAFPFQTLNFPVGTQQHLHSDSIHFSSVPERFMCGVWLAMEDIVAEAGPLTYLPGSHRWPVLNNVMIGRAGWGSQLHSAQEPFEAAWQALVEQSGQRAEVFLAHKGQALIWAANLLHGGSLQTDPTLTRWSQVTHYYFDDCIYYTPAFSDEPLGRLDLRVVTDIGSGAVRRHSFMGADVVRVEEAPAQGQRRWRWPWQQRATARKKEAATVLPAGFDGETYLALNPDVRQAGSDPVEHYLQHGHKERRRHQP